jgi:hypothetical protein
MKAPAAARWLLGFGLLAPCVAAAAEPAARTASAPVPAEPTFWAEREGDRLRVTVDLRPVFDAAWRTRLRNGLACVVAIELRLREHDGGKVRGRLRRVLPVRWDLWAEEMRREPGGEADFETQRWPSLEAFIDTVARADAVTMGERVRANDKVFFVDARVELNPWSVQAKALPPAVGGGTGAGAAPEAMFDALLHWAEDGRPGKAERAFSTRGHPFRADRLPAFRGPSPVPAASP